MISLTLPPGSVFAPSEEQLCCYYLTQKNRTPVDDETGADEYRDYDFIKELNVYEYHPSALPDYACYRYGDGGTECHWYFYTRESELEESQRIGIGGYWEIRAVDAVLTDKDVAVANVSVLDFYDGDPKTTAMRTHWVLNEYAGIEKGTFVVCRLFCRPRPKNTGGASSSGTKDHEFLLPDMPESKRKPDRSPDAPGGVLKDPSSSNQVPTTSTSVASVQDPTGSQASERVGKSTIIFLKGRKARASSSTATGSTSAASVQDPSGSQITERVGRRIIFLTGPRSRRSFTASYIRAQHHRILLPDNANGAIWNLSRPSADEADVLSDQSSNDQVASSSTSVADVQDHWGASQATERLRRSAIIFLRGRRSRRYYIPNHIRARYRGDLLAHNTVEEATSNHNTSAANDDNPSRSDRVAANSTSVANCKHPSGSAKEKR